MDLKPNSSSDPIPASPIPDLPFPEAGRLAAVDYGTVRIGVAVCDPDRILASPLEVYLSAGPDTNAKYFRTLAKQERLVGFVVGLPIHCDGQESQKSKEAREFARWIHQQTGLPVRLFDERFSTAAAKERLSGSPGKKGGSKKLTRQKRKQRLDAVAALVLLESFLESSRYHGQTAGVSIDQPPQGGETLE